MADLVPEKGNHQIDPRIDSTNRVRAPTGADVAPRHG